MAAIGSYTVEIWRSGQIIPAQKLCATVEAPPGVDGTGVIVGAWKRPPVTIQTANHYASGALAIAAQNTIRALAGTSVTVTDQFGTAHAGVIVLDVASSLSVTLLNTVRLEATWRLLATAAAPV